MRTFFIGDVHGCYDELLELTKKIHLQDDDHLYFVGDLINKGPKSLEVVEFIKNRPNTWSVIGNHEYFLMNSDEEIEKVFAKIPDMSPQRIEWIMKGREISRSIRESLEKAGNLEWILSLPTFIEKDDFILVHGGVHPDFGTDTPVEIATMMREYNQKPWYESYTGEKLIIYGHWAVDGLRIRKNTIGLDSGCVFGGHLTAYCLETHEIWQVHAHDVYKLPADHKGKIEKIKIGS